MEGKVENQKGLKWKKFDLLVGESRESAVAQTMPSSAGQQLSDWRE